MNPKKNILTAILPLLALLPAACSKESPKAVSIGGEIEGLGNDTLYIYGADKLYDHTDTLVTQNGKFTATLQTDTLAATWLLFPSGDQYPIYLGKKEHINIKGSTDDLSALQVEGNRDNELLTEFFTTLKQRQDTTATDSLAARFVETNNNSLASIYVLDRFFVQVPKPDFARIKALADRMTGELKDRPYMDDLLKRIEADERTSPGKLAPLLQLRGSDGKLITRAEFKNQYVLVHFWASWDTLSRQHNAAYRRLHKTEGKHKDFALLGISLDVDSAAWQKAIEQDTLKWRQGSELRGWASSVADLFALQALPANFLLSPTGHIEARNLGEEEVAAKMESLRKAKAEQEKRLNARKTPRRPLPNRSIQKE